MTASRQLSPAEAATLLGVSAKALRLYEQHGLVAPLRTGGNWRAYGPEQMARLHQVLALKRLGLPLARIAELLVTRRATLADVLALQEQVLGVEQDRLGRALALVRAARAKLKSGASLSIDDMATLTTETTMSSKPTDAEMKTIFDPFIAKHFPPEVVAETSQRYFDQAKVGAEWEVLIAEAKALMARGDDASPAALDLGRRWSALVGQFTLGDPATAERAANVWKDAMADPKVAPRLPMNAELFAFMGKVMVRLKAAGGP